MKYIKWMALFLILISVSKSHSLQRNGYGWNCFHNGVFYAMVGGNMSCPNPESVSSNGGPLAKHDPNDHTCIITRVANSNH